MKNYQQLVLEWTQKAMTLYKGRATKVNMQKAQIYEDCAAELQAILDQPVFHVGSEYQTSTLPDAFTDHKN